MATRLVLILVTALAAGGTAGADLQRATRTIPNAPWVEIYFSEIDRASSRMRLARLRDSRLSGGDVELRVWEGFGIGPLTGLVMKRSSGKWSARSARMSADGTSTTLPVPTSTRWADVWDELHRRGLAEIRDGSELPICHAIYDGVGYVVELATASGYRTYLVSNPQSQRSEDGDRFLRLLPTLLEAFGQKPWTDVDRLATGERRTVSSVSADVSATLTETSWVGQAPGGADNGTPERVLTSDQALAQAINLRTPTCAELPPETRGMRFVDAVGDVAIEVLITPDGAVRAARARSGWPVLHDSSIAAALKWSFVPVSDDNRLRRAMLTVRYREGWVDFPWLKRK